MNSEKQLILTGDLWKVCWKLALPAVIAMVLFGLNVVFDAIFIGRLVGEEALAGVSIAYPLTQISLGLGSLIGVGAGSYLSILIGQNDQSIQKRLLGNVNVAIIIISLIMMAIGFVFMDPLLHMIGASGVEFTYAKNYFVITLLGTVFWVAGIGYNMIVRAEGKMKTAAQMMGFGLLINIIANYILMVILGFGVEGAAWGTNIGMFVYVVLFWIYCQKGKASFDANVFRLYHDKSISKEIYSLGMPSLIMTIMSVIQGIIILKSLSIYGTTADVAFYGVVFRLYNLFLTPIYGLMRALQPAVGVNFGAKQYDRVIDSYKVFSFGAFLVMLPAWILSILAPTSVLHIMLPQASFSSADLLNFRIFISTAPLLCVVLTAMTFWPAIKKPKPAMFIGIGRQLFLYIPLMIILPRLYGIRAIYFGSFFIDSALAIVILFMVRNEFRLLRNVKEIPV